MTRATTVVVRRRLKAPATALFDVLTDPAKFATVRGIRSVEVLEEGAGGPVSVGTVRRVNLSAGYLVEEIVGLDATTFDYLIRDVAGPALDHTFGRIEFRDVAGGTEATWTSTFALPVPVVGGLLGLAAGAGSRLAFHAALREMDRAALKES